jgi:hypothetical protein
MMEILEIYDIHYERETSTGWHKYQSIKT